MYSKILVPLDGSVLAEMALRHAIPLAQANEAELHVLRVADPGRIPVPPDAVDFDVREQLRQQIVEDAQAYIRGVAANNQTLNVTPHFMSGSVADKIIEKAEELGIDLIVLSTHGRSGISRWMHGSVAQKLLRASPCSMLVVQTRKEASG